MKKEGCAAGLREAVSDCILNGGMTGSEVESVVDDVLDSMRARAKKVLA